MAFRYDFYHKSTIFALNFTRILGLVLLKPVKTALHGNDYSESYHVLELAGMPHKYNQSHTTSVGLSSVCAKLEQFFLMGEFPIPQLKKSSKPPPPGPIKRAKTPPPGVFSSIIYYKNMKK